MLFCFLQVLFEKSTEVFELITAGMVFLLCNKQIFWHTLENSKINRFSKGDQKLSWIRLLMKYDWQNRIGWSNNAVPNRRSRCKLLYKTEQFWGVKRTGSGRFNYYYESISLNNACTRVILAFCVGQWPVFRSSAAVYSVRVRHTARNFETPFPEFEVIPSGTF